MDPEITQSKPSQTELQKKTGSASSSPTPVSSNPSMEQSSPSGKQESGESGPVKLTKKRFRPAHLAKTEEIHRHEDGTFDFSYLSQDQYRFVNAYRKADGILGAAIREYGTPREKVEKWRKENKTFDAMLRSVDEDIIDMVREQNMKKIRDGQVHATLAFLRSRAPEFSEKKTISGKIELSPSWYDNTPEASVRRKISRAESKKLNEVIIPQLEDGDEVRTE